nr:VacJ family lipoprotein [Hyphomicrobium methylovorum]
MTACAGVGSAPAPVYLASPEKESEPKSIADPYEKSNRSVFESNQDFNHSVLYPAAKAYNENVPEPVRDRIESFTTNLNEPMVFANNVLQLRPLAAATTLGRFAMNTTIGLGGLFDVAATEGLTRQSGDFGQTMYVWGYRESSYLVLPIIGPTNVRDAIGTGVEFGAQLPLATFMPTKIATLTSRVDLAGTVASPLANLSKAEDMQTLEESSIDFYSMLRSVTDQKRQAELQEALDTSALTSTPPPPDPNAIEPVMTIVSSPTLLPNYGKNLAKTAKARASNGTVMIVGTPSAAAPAEVSADTVSTQ